MNFIKTTIIRYFYPRSPCGERPLKLRPSSISSLFLSTLSLRRATRWWHWWAPRAIFLSTLSLRRATYRRQHTGCIWRNFYPRSPCGERLDRRHKMEVSFLFLSTLSLRRATGRFYCFSPTSFNFYPRSPCGERLIKRCQRWASTNFYPRSPCGERQITP